MFSSYLKKGKHEQNFVESFLYCPPFVKRTKPNVPTQVSNISISSFLDLFTARLNMALTNKENRGNLSSFDSLKRSFGEFLRNTTLHGLKYTADTKLSYLERVFFLLAFGIVFIVSVFFISNVYNKWSATPLLISTSPNPIYTSTIPFPAVTICSLNQAKRSKVSNIKKGTLNYTLLQSLCSHKDENDILQSAFGKWSIFKKFITEVSQSCEEMIIFCRFGLKEENCDSLFTPILTDDGLCCTFNSVDPMFMFSGYNKETYDLDLKPDIVNSSVQIDWTPESGYPQNLPMNFYPRITKGTGSHMGLTVVLNTSSKEYYCATTKGIGFKILTHNPVEQSKIANYGFLVSTGYEARVTINPSFQQASPSLRHISTKIRNCLFSDEGNLSYYRTYTRKNCELECESKILQKECGCVLYYMPKSSEDAVICGPRDNQCTKRIQNAIESADNENFTCEVCYPACFELSYASTISAIKISNDLFLTPNNYPERLVNNYTDDVSIIHIFYANNVFRSSIQEELIGVTEFLSNTGGLLGLFLGFSIFSLIEIFYYLCLRPYSEVKIRKRKIDKKKKLVQPRSNTNLEKSPWNPEVIIYNRKYSYHNSTALKNSSLTRIHPTIFPYYE